MNAMASTKRRTRRHPIPTNVWVAFDESHFPIGVTRLEKEALEWSREDDVVVKKYALVELRRLDLLRLRR